MLPLFEYEAKRLFSQYGIPVQVGALWPLEGGLRFPVMVKAQLLEGGRGKRGGIRAAHDLDECRHHAEELLGTGLPSLTPGHGPDRTSVPHVYVEERAAITKELYLSIGTNRDLKCATILASPAGGVDIERHGESVEQIPIDKCAGIQPYMVRRVARLFGLNTQQAAQLGKILTGMWRLFVAEEALLIEINPLAIDEGGNLIALDAKLGLDENAGFRHAWSKDRPQMGTPFEAACSGLGVTGVELGEGPVACVMSGAGLMMATLDILKSCGGKVGWMIDLGGVVFQDAAKLTEVVKVVRSLKPKVILFSYSLQVARCDVLASAIAAGFPDEPEDVKVIVRMKGYGSEEGRKILNRPGFHVTTDFVEGCDQVLAAAKEVSAGGNPD